MRLQPSPTRSHNDGRSPNRRCGGADDHHGRPQAPPPGPRRPVAVARARGDDAVLFIAGDVDAVRLARRAGVFTATAREIETLRRGGSSSMRWSAAGRTRPSATTRGIDPEPALVVTTSGALGGWTQPGGPSRRRPSRGPWRTRTAAGDSFMAGLTFALGAGLGSTLRRCSSLPNVAPPRSPVAVLRPQRVGAVIVPSTGLVEADDDLVSLRPDGVAPNAEAVVDSTSAGRDVELPLVPWASHDAVGFADREARRSRPGSVWRRLPEQSGAPRCGQRSASA